MIKRFIVNGIIASASALIINIIAMFFNVHISNTVGAEAIGVHSLVISVYALAITVASSGVNIATTKIISENLAKDSNCNVKHLGKQCLFFSFVISIIASIIFFFLAKTISVYWLHGKVKHITLYFIALALPFISMSSCINAYFCAVRRIYKSSLGQILESIVKIIATLLLLKKFISMGIEYIVLSLIVGDVISEIVSFAYLYFVYNHDLNKLPMSYSNLNCSRRFFNIGTPVAVTSYIKSGLSTLKQLLIPIKLESSGISCDKALSQYGVIGGMVMTLFMFPSIFINSFSNLLVPEITCFYEKKEFFKINRSINIIFKIAFTFAFCVFGIFANFSDEIGMLMYNNEDVPFFLKLLCPIILFIYLDNIIDCILKGLNKQVGIMFCNILDLVVSIALICTLLPIKGILGYVIVMYVSEILNFSISLFQLKKAINLDFDYLNWFVKPFLAVVISSFIIKWRITSPFYNTFPEVATLVITFILIYLLVYWIVSKVLKFH